MSPSLYVTSLQPFSTCTFLIHIHVLTCVNVPISLGHVTTQNKIPLMFKCTCQFRRYYIIAYTWLQLIMVLKHNSVTCKVLIF